MLQVWTQLKAAFTLVTFPQTLARNRSKDNVICYAEIRYIHTERNILANIFACHVNEHVTSVDAAKTSCKQTMVCIPDS
jgi:hypothetical protein